MSNMHLKHIQLFIIFIYALNKAAASTVEISNLEVLRVSPNLSLSLSKLVLVSSDSIVSFDLTVVTNTKHHANHRKKIAMVLCCKTFKRLCFICWLKLHQRFKLSENLSPTKMNCTFNTSTSC